MKSEIEDDLKVEIVGIDFPAPQMDREAETSMGTRNLHGKCLRSLKSNIGLGP
jgi:hypothetical protein